MRKSISVAVIALIGAMALWTWTLTNSGANARNKLSMAAHEGVNTLDLTVKATNLPVQQFDAH